MEYRSMLQAIAELLLEPLYFLVFHFICYPVGWPLVKLFSLGRYPRQHFWFKYCRDTFWTGMLGMVVLVLLVMALCGQFVLPA